MTSFLVTSSNYGA